MAGLRDLNLGKYGTIPSRFLHVRYSRSGGPGGQNVNKVASKADLRLDLERTLEVLTEISVQRIRNKMKNRLDADGQLQVICSEYRDQARNLEAAHLRMEGFLKSALARPKVRRKTKRSKGSNERRLKTKKERSEIKSSRNKKWTD